MRNIVPRRLGLILAFLATSAFVHCEQAQAQNDHLIVPWERIGPVVLGMTAADLTRIKGDPTQTSRGPTGGISVYTWKNDLSVYIKSDGSYVTQICAARFGLCDRHGCAPGYVGCLGHRVVRQTKEFENL